MPTFPARGRERLVRIEGHDDPVIPVPILAERQSVAAFFHRLEVLPSVLDRRKDRDELEIGAGEQR